MRRVMDLLTAHTAESRNADRLPVTEGGGEPDPTEILNALYKSDRVEQKARHGTTYIHASYFIGQPKCSRMFFLLRKMQDMGVYFPDRVLGNMRMIWTLGRGVERHIRDSLLADEGIREAAYGVWVCKCGTTRVEGHAPANPRPCPRCRRKPTTYNELTLFDKKRKIAGNPDFALRQNGKYTVVEVKSIKMETTTAGVGFKELTAPAPDHAVQGTHYRELFRERGLPVHSKPLIIYAAKDFVVKGGWYKPFLPSDELQRQANADVKAHRAVAKDYAEHIEVDTLPPMIAECAANIQAKCKTCPAWAECSTRAASGL